MEIVGLALMQALILTVLITQQQSSDQFILCKHAGDIRTSYCPRMSPCTSEIRCLDFTLGSATYFFLWTSYLVFPSFDFFLWKTGMVKTILLSRWLRGLTKSHCTALGIVVHTYNPRAWELEAGGPWIQGQPGLHSKSLSQKSLWLFWASVAQ
jgi:hypothetical protein